MKRDADFSGAGGALTRREAEVAHWVARGLSDAQVGGALGVSGCTVGDHLKHIFNKLEFKNRTQLAVHFTTSAPEPALFREMTPRDMEVVHYISHGLSNKEVARELSISSSTVAEHIKTMLEVTGMHNRVALAALYTTTKAHLMGPPRPAHMPVATVASQSL